MATREAARAETSSQAWKCRTISRTSATSFATRASARALTADSTTTSSEQQKLASWRMADPRARARAEAARAATAQLALLRLLRFQAPRTAAKAVARDHASTSRRTSVLEATVAASATLPSKPKSRSRRPEIWWRRWGRRRRVVANQQTRCSLLAALLWPASLLTTTRSQAGLAVGRSMDSSADSGRRPRSTLRPFRTSALRWSTSLPCPISARRCGLACSGQSLDGIIGPWRTLSTCRWRCCSTRELRPRPSWRRLWCGS